MCQGVFNMKFSNSWINGTLYHFKFTRIKAPTVGFSGTTQDTFCPRVVHRHPEVDDTGTLTGNVFFYYRSSPYNTGVGFKLDNAIDSQNTSTYGSKHEGLNFPTTITELGPLDECTHQLCNEEIEDCYFVDKLKPSSYQHAEYVLGALVEDKISMQSFSDFVWSGVNKFFGADGEPGNTWNSNSGNRRWGYADNALGAYGLARPSRLIDGDMSVIIATNNQLGIEPYLPSTQSPYYQTISSSDVGTTFTRVALVPNEAALIQCLQGGSIGIPQTQIKPYYTWNKIGAAPYGAWNSDWSIGATVPSIDVTGNQQGTNTNGPTLSPFPSPISPPEYWNTGLVQTPSGSYGISISNPIPSTTMNIKLGVHQYFYFGLRQGATSYDIFLNKYLKASNE